MSYVSITITGLAEQVGTIAVQAVQAGLSISGAKAVSSEPAKSVTCKFCKTEDLQWRKSKRTQKSYLVTANGAWHQCSAFPKRDEEPVETVPLEDVPALAVDLITG